MHEPDFSALAAVLLGPDSGPEIRFKKGAVLGLSFDHHPAPGEATLAFFYRAEDLAALV